MIQQGSIITNPQGEQLDYSFHSASCSNNCSDTVVLLGHGLTGNKDRELIVALAEGVSAQGWDCLRFSYSGNGASQGSYTDMCISKEVVDLQSVIGHVQAEYKKIIYIGHSMGGAVGALTVAKDNNQSLQAIVSLAGMVNTQIFCQTEFGNQIPDASDMWDEPEHPLTQLYVDDLTNIQSVLPATESVTIPWLIIHGDADDVVLPIDSQQLYNQLPTHRQLLVIADADHSFSQNQEQVVTAVANFLQEVLNK